MIKSFAALKRTLTPGTRLVLVETNLAGHRALNVVRTVVKQQTNAVKFSDGSWLYLGATGEKAGDFSFQEDGFTLDDRYRDPHGVRLVYKFVETAADETQS